MTALLEASGIRAGYGQLPVLFDVDITVGEGEIVALLGANGAGKTTTLRALSGMLPLMSGDIKLNGAPMRGLAPERRAHAGLLHIPEGRGIFPSLGVSETLRLAAAMAGVSRGEVPGLLDGIYQLFGPLAQRRNQPASTLSGGEQQMLAIARGLIMKPTVLLVDEMSQGLAPAVVQRLFEVIRTLPGQGVSVLIVEQFVRHALAVASRAYVLEKGAVVFSGAARELAADEDFVKGSYLGGSEAEILAGAGDGQEVPPVTDDQEMSLPAGVLKAIEEKAAAEGASTAEIVVRMLAEAAERGGGGSGA